MGSNDPADGGRVNCSISEAKTAVPLSPTRISGEVFAKRTRRCGATGSQIPARDAPTTLNKIRHKKNERGEEKKRKGTVGRFRTRASRRRLVANRKAVDFLFFFFLLGNANNMTEGPADKVPPGGWQRSKQDCCRIQTTGSETSSGARSSSEDNEKEKKESL